MADEVFNLLFTNRKLLNDFKNLTTEIVTKINFQKVVLTSKK
jgi:hypothetical protein